MGAPRWNDELPSSVCSQSPFGTDLEAVESSKQAATATASLLASWKGLALRIVTCPPAFAPRAVRDKKTWADTDDGCRCNLTAILQPPITRKCHA